MRRWLNSTTLVFVALVAIVVVWIGSGVLFREEAAEEAPPQARLPVVAASWSEADVVVRRLVLYGDVAPAQTSMIRARVDGIVEEILAAGTAVEAGQVVGRLSTDDRAARLARAQAQLAAAERDYDATRQLAERDIAPEQEVQALFAQLEAARAELRAVELEISFTELTAPTAGVINRVIADAGAYVPPGGDIAEIVNNDPLVAVIDVPQANITDIRLEMPALVRFIGGEELEGSVSFIAPIARAETRTFRVEVEVPNPGGAIPSGLSAEVEISYARVAAHRISPALFRLDEQGRIGVYLLDEEDRIVFAPVDVVRAEADGVWVTGLPERVRMVTVSQGALAPGQAVEVRETPPEYVTGADGAGARLPAGTIEADAEDTRPADMQEEGGAP